mgnify:CR=1 FL=1
MPSRCRPSRSRLRRRQRITFCGESARALPRPGIIGVFDRSHYEDVLVPRVHELIPEAEWRRRYEEINAFEAGLVEQGTTVVKCLLHISYATQRARLLARLEDPTKWWKFNEGDITERAYWAGLSGGIRRHAPALLARARAMVRRPERPEVVPELGCRATARRDA